MAISKLISHRGNINGPDISNENHPTYIEKAINLGFDCEVDIWVVNKELFLGHDEPMYKTTVDFLSNYVKYL